MNLLRIQDALKNASDQQLMQLMQAPDSTAPSYLVLSEIRRRKDMRAKQAPEGQSNRTVAEDLTAPEDQGIRGMQMPEEPPQDVSDQSGIEAMREGGVVRMQAGGELSRRPLSEMSPEELRELRRQFDFGALANRMPNLPGVRSAGRPQYTLEELAAEDFRRQSMNRPNQPSRFMEDPESAFANRSPDQMIVQAPTPAEPTTTTQAQTQPPPPATTTPTAPQPQPDPNAERNRTLDSLRSALPARPDENAERRAAARGEGRPAGAAGAAAAPAATEGGLPTMADIYRQNQGLFADGIGALRERAQQERVDPAARRSEAVNMALIEAGLRIAGSRNPSLVGAIGEGALPAVQSYGQQLGQIRAEQREARRDELELAKQELNRQFAVGQISATEYRTRMDNITRTNIADRQERMVGARAAEADARADRRIEAQGRLQADELRRRGYYTPEELAAMSPQQRALVQEQRSMGRPADTAGAGTVLNATIAEIGRIRTEMDGDIAPRPTSSGYADWQRRDAERRERLRVAEERRTRLEDVVFLGRAPGGRTATGGGQGSGISQFGG